MALWIDVLIFKNDKASIYDPWVGPKEGMHEYGLEITNELPSQKYGSGVGRIINYFKEVNWPLPRLKITVAGF